MRTACNQVAGQNVERPAALSDRFFAVARRRQFHGKPAGKKVREEFKTITLLVLDLHAPAVEAIHGEQGLWRALQQPGPRQHGERAVIYRRFPDARETREFTIPASARIPPRNPPSAPPDPPKFRPAKAPRSGPPRIPNPTLPCSESEEWRGRCADPDRARD
jgi:hypothetical protein